MSFPYAAQSCAKGAEHSFERQSPLMEACVENPKPKRSLLLFLRIAFALLLLTFLVTSIGITSIIDAILGMDLILASITICSLILLFILGAFNIWIILISFCPLRFSVFLRAYTFSWITNLLAPMQLGDATLSLFLKRQGMSFRHSGISYLTDKAVTVAVLSWVGWYGATILLPDSDTTWIILLPFLLLLLCPISFILIRRLPGSHRLMAVFEAHREKIIEDIWILFSKKHILTVNLLLTLVKWLLMSCCYFFAFLAHGQYVSWPEIAVIPVLSTLAGYLPVSIGGVGTVEFTAIYFFSKMGVDKSIVLSVYLFLRLAQYVLAAMIMLFVQIRKPDNTRM